MLRAFFFFKYIYFKYLNWMNYTNIWLCKSWKPSPAGIVWFKKIKAPFGGLIISHDQNSPAPSPIMVNPLQEVSVAGLFQVRFWHSHRTVEREERNGLTICPSMFRSSQWEYLVLIKAWNILATQNPARQLPTRWKARAVLFPPCWQTLVTKNPGELLWHTASHIRRKYLRGSWEAV